MFAISLHNLLESLALGVGYAASETIITASVLTNGVTIQDILEGFVALLLLNAGYS